MNKFSLRLIIALIAISISSCIVIMPKKKYKALVNEKEMLAKNLGIANTKIDSLNKLVAAQRDTINMLRTDTTILWAKVRNLQSQLKTSSDNYQQLRNNSNQEVKKLLDSLESAQRNLASREARLKEVEDMMSRRDEAVNALKEKLTNALLGFKNLGLDVTVKDGKVYVSLTDKLLFASGSIEIDEKGKQALVELAKVLKTQQDINILVEGHTDNVKVSNLGQIKDNWDLSVLRATAVVRYLTETQKLEALRVTASGRGEFQPVEKANTTEAKSRNRRIEIVLSPKLDELFNLIEGK